MFRYVLGVWPRVQEREAARGFAELGPPMPLVALQVMLLEMAVGLSSANPLAAPRLVSIGTY